MRPAQNAFRYFISILFLAVVYFATAKFGLELGAIEKIATPVWPPTGLALAALLLGSRKLWPGILLGAFCVNLLVTHHGLAALGIAIGNTLEAVIAEFLLRKFKFNKRLARPKDVLTFVGIAAPFSTMVSASIGTATSFIFGIVPLAEVTRVWASWWVGDMLGDLVLVPFLLIWVSQKFSWERGWKLVEMALMALSLVSASGLLFSGWVGPEYRHYVHSYLAFPPLIWAAYRFGQRASTLALFALSILSIVGTVSGYGPFAGTGRFEDLLSLQMFIGTAAFTFLFFSAIVQERREVVSQLEASEKKFKRLVDANIIGIFFWTRDGRIVQPNQAFLQMLGYSPADFKSLGLSWRALTPPEFQDKLDQAFSNLQATGTAQAYEKDLLRQDGSRVPVVMGSAIVGDAQGTGVSFVLDVSDAKRNLDELKIAVQEREDIVAIVSHDLKTPLSSILLNTKLLHGVCAAAGPESHKSIGQRVERIERSTQKMQRLIDDILDVTKLKAGTLFLESHRENARVLVEEAIELLQPLIEEKVINLRFETANAECILYCDHERSLQVLSNLIGNAIKFTPPEGTILITLEERGGEAYFSIQDSGPGISREQLPHIFDRYWQAKRSGKQGIGLGLSIAKGIVEAHGGRIWAECRPVGGAAFHFTLPAPKNALLNSELAPGSP